MPHMAKPIFSLRTPSTKGKGFFTRSIYIVNASGIEKDMERGWLLFSALDNLLVKVRGICKKKRGPSKSTTEIYLQPFRRW